MGSAVRWCSQTPEADGGAWGAVPGDIQGKNACFAQKGRKAMKCWSCSPPGEEVSEGLSFMAAKDGVLLFTGGEVFDVGIWVQLT